MELMSVVVLVTGGMKMNISLQLEWGRLIRFCHMSRVRTKMMIQ